MSDSTTIPPNADPKPAAPMAKAPTRRPWRPYISGVIGILFGPAAAAIVTFINLRRMHAPRKAKWVLIGTALACVLFGMATYYFGEYISRQYGLVAQTSVAIFYTLFQREEFENWKAADHQPSPANGWSAFLWAIPGLTMLVILFGAGLMPFLLLEKTPSIHVMLYRDGSFQVDRESRLGIQIKNTADTPFLLKSIELDQSFSKTFNVVSSDPPFERKGKSPGISIYYYDIEMAQGDVELITLVLAPKSSGQFSSWFGICMNSWMNCSEYPLNIQVHSSRQRAQVDYRRSNIKPN